MDVQYRENARGWPEIPRDGWQADRGNLIKARGVSASCAKSTMEYLLTSCFVISFKFVLVLLHLASGRFASHHR